MDQTKNNAKSNNANAPGTYPPDNKDKTQQAVDYARNTQGSSYSSDDPKTPLAADPLNGLVPRTQASQVEDGSEVLEMELGGTGTIIVSGVLSQNDYNSDLTGFKRVEVFDQMRLGDATVKLGLLAVKHPLLSATWFVKHGDGEEDSGPITTFVKQELFQNPNFSWTTFLHQALLFCDYGNSVFEKVFRMRADGKIGWKKFAQRLPKTIWRYTMQDGKTPGITQQLPTGGMVEIPQWKLLMFVNELEGANYEGISLLRSAYKHWYYKDTYYKIDAIATERQGMGVPVIRVPAQANPKDKLKAREIARNMRTNEAAYMDLPEGFTVEYIDTKAKELKEVKEMVIHHDREILKAMLAQFLDLGATTAGSQTASDNQYDMFLNSLHYLAHVVQEQVNHAIRELVDLNFSGMTPDKYPTLEYGSLGKTDFSKLAVALKDLAQAGVIVPDDDLEKHVRAAMELPEAMKFSDEENINPEDRKTKTPDLTSQDVQEKKPIRYVNKEARQRQDAMTFMEDLMTLKSDIETAIQMREQ